MLLSFCACKINLFAPKNCDLKIEKVIYLELLKLRWMVITKDAG